MDESKILVIDDEQVICDACSQMFTKDGYLVETCLEGTSGLEKIDNFKPDVVFVDLKMPGMSGIEVLEKIREKDKNVVTVIISGYGTVESAVESLNKGAFDFLPKPLTPEKLKVITRRALAERKSLLEVEHQQDKETGIKREHYTHIADLAAFVKPLDLPPSLYPFAKSAGWKMNTDAEQDIRFLMLKIRGTIDSYHAIVVKNNMTIEDIEEKIHKELEIVKLSNATRARLKALLKKFRKGEFTYFVNHQINKAEYPHRH